MAPARALAAQLAATLAPAREAFARLCPRLCPDCREPCCRRISPHGLLDQVDLLFMAAQGLADLPAPPPVSPGCPFLAVAGCRLPWAARPFACLRYLCRPIQDALTPGDLASLAAALTRAAGLRADLAAAFLVLDPPE